MKSIKAAHYSPGVMDCDGKSFSRVTEVGDHAWDHTWTYYDWIITPPICNSGSASHTCTTLPNLPIRKSLVAHEDTLHSQPQTPETLIDEFLAERRQMNGGENSSEAVPHLLTHDHYCFHGNWHLLSFATPLPRLAP